MKRRRRGVTLTESIAVAAILGILIISLPIAVSSIISGVDRVNKRIIYSSLIDRAVELFMDKDNEYFEVKRVTYSFDNMDELENAIINNQNVDTSKKYLLTGEFKEAKLGEPGLYVLQLSITSDDEKSSVLEREVIIRGEKV